MNGRTAYYSERWRREVAKLSARTEAMAPADWRASIAGRALPIADVLADGEWSGQPCFIVGGGPSLSGFDFRRLPPGRTIVVNRAWESMPWARILFSIDSLYYRWAAKKPETDPRRFPGLKVWIDTYGFPYQDVLLAKSRGERGLSESLELGLYHGSNSGYGAIGLAACLGADPIYLLGFDMDFAGPRTHFHSGYPMGTGRDKVARYIENFDDLAPRLKARGIRVVNLNPDSALDCFEKAMPEEALA